MRFMLLSVSGRMFADLIKNWTEKLISIASTLSTTLSTQGVLGCVEACVAGVLDDFLKLPGNTGLLSSRGWDAVIKEQSFERFCRRSYSLPP